MVFQSTHPRGVRHFTSSISICAFQNFNPRTRVGCDRRIPRAGALCSDFNPRTRVGCDFHLRAGARRSKGFQSTHPRGVRPREAIAVHSLFQNFNPRTRVGCDIGYVIFHSKKTHFNPRTRVGCDPRRSHPIPGAVEISIHAPAWGATFRPAPLRTFPAEFQSTHLRGVRPDRLRGKAVENYFNPRTRVGCDFMASGFSDLGGDFNPRTRVGCDLPYRVYFFGSVYFNPRTRVGCDYIFS